MYIAILGRQPALGMAELESLYGPDNTKWFSDTCAVISTDTFSLDRLGGSQKAGRVVAELAKGDWRKTSMQIVKQYLHEWQHIEGKITLGISAYGFDVSPRDIQKTGIILKNKLKEKNASLRLIPNNDTSLNSATSHHNKLGLSDNKVELLVVRARDGRVIVAESIGAQNITAYTKRDQERPKRDAFVGMLPPKLAQIIVNLSGAKKFGTLWDPFCGTGVLLQEALLMGIDVYGSDISEKMIDYSEKNLEWLRRIYDASHGGPKSMWYDLRVGDATAIEFINKHTAPLGAVACETYLGQPFSAPPSPSKLAEVQKNCDYIIGSFLKNIHPQLAPGTPLCIAVPAWRDAAGHFTHLKLTSQLDQLGYTRRSLHHVRNADLLYYREDQVVARELLVLSKS